MGEMIIKLNKPDAEGTRSYDLANVVAALMEHDSRMLFVLHSSGTENIFNLDEVSQIESKGIEIKHA